MTPVGSVCTVSGGWCLVLIAGLGWVLFDGPDLDLVRDAARTFDERGHRDTAEQLGYVMKATDDLRQTSAPPADPGSGAPPREPRPRS